MKPNGITEQYATYFAARPGIWIDGRVLATVAACYGWRTEVSRCRRQLQMNIINRRRYLTRPDGTRFTISEYCYLPTEVGTSEIPSDQFNANTEWGLR